MLLINNGRLDLVHACSRVNNSLLQMFSSVGLCLLYTGQSVLHSFCMLCAWSRSICQLILWFVRTMLYIPCPSLATGASCGVTNCSEINFHAFSYISCSLFRRWLRSWGEWLQKSMTQTLAVPDQRTGHVVLLLLQQVSKLIFTYHNEMSNHTMLYIPSVCYAIQCI